MPIWPWKAHMRPKDWGRLALAAPSRRGELVRQKTTTSVPRRRARPAAPHPDPLRARACGAWRGEGSGVLDVPPGVRPAGLTPARRHRREGGERRGEHHRAGAGTAAAVRGGEGLVQVDVHGVDAEVAGADPADDGVEVGPVAVEDRRRPRAGPAISITSRSNRPQVLGLVTMMAATSGELGSRGRPGRRGRLARGDGLDDGSRRRRRWPGWCRGPRSGTSTTVRAVASRPRARR